VIGPNGEVQIWWTNGGTAETDARPNEHRVGEINWSAQTELSLDRINRGSSNLGCATDGWKQTETPETWKTGDSTEP
jgi:hypothetical protein